MIKTDEDALICDLAETYHIYDWRKLPVRFVATLAYGLSDDSRIKRKMSGNKVSIDTQLRALILDGISLLVWSKTEDAENGRNQPKSYYEFLMGKEESNEGFESVEDFEAARAQILGG